MNVVERFTRGFRITPGAMGWACMSRARTARARGFRLPAEVIAGALLCTCYASLANAQTTRPQPRLEVSVGAGLLSGESVGGPDAELRTGSQSPYPLFASDARIAGAPTIEASVAWRFARRFAIEGHGRRAGQDLEVSVTADAEGAPPVTVAERIDRYIVGAGLVVLFDELRLARLMPFAVAGAGYLRQLHEGSALVEESHVFHAGAGVKRSLMTRSGRLLDSIGVRGDARVYVFGHGFAREDSPRPYVSVTGSVVLAF